MDRIALVASALALVALPLASITGPWAETEQSAVRLVSRWTAAAAGVDAGLGIEFRLAPGWHVYWKNAGDAGYAPQIDFAPGPLAGAELLFPAPRRFELAGGLVAFGYENEVVYPLAATLSASAASPARLDAEIDYLVCAEQCIPYNASLLLDLPLAAEPVEDGEVAPTIDRWRGRLPVPVDGLAGGKADAELHRATGPELDLELSIAADGLVARTPDLFFEPHALLALERPRVIAGSTPTRFRVHLRPLDETKPLPERLDLAWTATGFELGGAPTALAGALDLARPASSAASGAPVRWLAAFAVVAAIALWLHRRAGSGTADESA